MVFIVRVCLLHRYCNACLYVKSYKGEKFQFYKLKNYV